MTTTPIIPKEPEAKPENPSLAQLLVKRTILKHLHLIIPYNGHYADDGACKYLWDCEYYFCEVAQFSGAEPTDYNKVIGASRALVKRTGETWQTFEQQVASKYGEPIWTWEAYMN